MKIKYESLVVEAAKYAIKKHKDVNHLYDGKSYGSGHLSLVYDFGVKYKYLLPKDKVNYALAACWTHDVIEDCRESYNDVMNILGVEVADITFNLTNEKGKFRKDRANDKYYAEIYVDLLSCFVKVCDRLANTSYSKKNGSSMFNKYKNEYLDFREKLFRSELKNMFQELDEIYYGALN